ncbi:hypothetical protein F5876DRAFT_73775 [Lentinula aff. lateritia]|uniref:Uncharacterized protein n=1 Tax=Lentinula aff. lateritia TaxID=2804960 RepID=A0ACC1UAI8_9AGAR|nr:hypothetical protein F5876DRAFT_73775 [Lentinula aff. lateritia]
MTTPLPKRDEHSVPKFDPKNEVLLPNFFEEFECTAKAAGIDKDAEKMKRTVLGYLDAKTMRFWQSLDIFDDDAKTWEDFKTKILDYYPGTTGTSEVTTKELVWVVETFQKKAISTTQELAEYREFAVVAKALRTQGTLSEILIAQCYVRPFPESIRTRIDTGLYVHYLTKKVALVSSGSFHSGDRIVIPCSTIKETPAIKTKPKDAEDSLSQQVAALTQMMPQLVRDNKNRENGTGKPPDWVAKGKVEQNERGFVQLKGGWDLLNRTKYKQGLVKTRFKHYFEENLSVKTWILDVSQPPGSPLVPALAGIEVSQHNAYTLESYQGPSMLATAAAYMLQGENNLFEAVALLDITTKTHHSISWQPSATNR